MHICVINKLLNGHKTNSWNKYVLHSVKQLEQSRQIKMRIMSSQDKRRKLRHRDLYSYRHSKLKFIITVEQKVNTWGVTWSFSLELGEPPKRSFQESILVIFSTSCTTLRVSQISQTVSNPFTLLYSFLHKETRSTMVA